MVYWRPFGDAGSAARCEHYCVCCEFDRAVGCICAYFVGSENSAGASVNLDTLARQELGHGLFEALFYSLNASSKMFGVDAGFDVGQAHAIYAASEGECCAGCNHGFRWHAIAKVGCSTDNVTFDECDISAESCCRGCSIVSCGATAYNYDPLVCHVRSLGCEFGVAVSGP